MKKMRIMNYLMLDTRTAPNHNRIVCIVPVSYNKSFCKPTINPLLERPLLIIHYIK